MSAEDRCQMEGCGKTPAPHQVTVILDGASLLPGRPAPVPAEFARPVTFRLCDDCYEPIKPTGPFSVGYDVEDEPL